MHLPGLEMTTVDFIDQCIFNCYQCYSKGILLECANNCITMEGNVDAFWSKCKYFNSVPLVDMI